MKASQFFVSTYKEAPADAEVVSHKLMTVSYAHLTLPTTPYV